METAVRDRIYEFIQASGLRRTVRRDAIIEAAFSHTDHYTAEELLVRARSIEPLVSRATVYRTLPLLVESGLLKELDLGKDQMFYDPNYIDHPRHSLRTGISTRWKTASRSGWVFRRSRK